MNVIVDAKVEKIRRQKRQRWTVVATAVGVAFFVITAAVAYISVVSHSKSSFSTI